MPYHGVKSQKNPLHRSRDNSFCNFGPKLGHNLTFGPKEHFSKNVTGVIFLYILWPIMLERLKKILRADPEILDNFGPQLGRHYPFDPNEDFPGNFT